MKIRHSYTLFAVTSTLFLVIMGVVLFKALNIQDDVVRSEEHRYRSFLLAIELFQSSEDLTRMARSYVTTGNPLYENATSKYLTSVTANSHVQRIIRSPIGILPV